MGREPIGLVHDREGGRVFTTDARSDVVSVIDTATLKTVKQIPVQHYPAGAGFYPERRKVYIGNTADNTVSVIDADRLEVIATVPAKMAAGSLGSDPVRDRVYCVNFGDASMTVIDGQSNEPIGEIKLDYAPCKIAIDAPRGRAYVANSLVSTVSVVDLDRQEVVDTLTVERAPVGMGLGRRGTASTPPTAARAGERHRPPGRPGMGAGAGRQGSRGPGGRPAVGHRVRLGCGHQHGQCLPGSAGGRARRAAERLAASPDRKAPPALQLPDMADGRPRTAEEFRGKKYILNFFASW